MCTVCLAHHFFLQLRPLFHFYFLLSSDTSFFFHWRIIALQCCVDFCWTTMWVSHNYMYIASLLSFHAPIHLLIIPLVRVSLIWVYKLCVLFLVLKYLYSYFLWGGLPGSSILGWPLLSLSSLKVLLYYFLTLIVASKKFSVNSAVVSLQLICLFPLAAVKILSLNATLDRI